MKDELRDEAAAASSDEASTPAKSRTARVANGEPVIVKKYANRRLYNTALSCYITLEDLAAMVRSGQDFVVQDAKSGTDLTRSVLTQIIFEQEGRDQPLLPVSFLRQLIRMYGDAMQGYVPGYLEMTMSAFERHQESLRAHMERSFGGSAGYAQMETMARANMELFRKAMGMFTPFGPRPEGAANESAAASPEPAGEPAASSEVDPQEAARRDAEMADLRAQLAALQTKLDALAKD